MQGTPTNQGDQLATTPADLLTVSELAELVRCKKNLIYQRPELIPGLVRIGSMIRYRRADVLAFIEAGGTSAPEA